MISNSNKKILLTLVIVIILSVVVYLVYNNLKSVYERFNGLNTVPTNLNETTTTTSNESTTAPNTTVPDTTVPDTTAPNTTIPDTTIPDTTVPDTTVPDTTTITSNESTTAPNTTIPDTTTTTTTSNMSSASLLNELNSAAQNGIRTDVGAYGIIGNLGNKDNINDFMKDANLLGNNIYVSPMNNDQLYNPQAKLSQLGKISSSFFPIIKIAQ